MKNKGNNNNLSRSKWYFRSLILILLFVFIFFSLSSLYLYFVNLARGSPDVALNSINIVYEYISTYIILSFLISLPIAISLFRYNNSINEKSRKKNSLIAGLFTSLLTTTYLFIIFIGSVQWYTAVLFFIIIIPLTLIISFIFGKIIFRLSIYFLNKNKFIIWATMTLFILILANLSAIYLSNNIKNKFIDYYTLPDGSYEEKLAHCNQDLDIREEWRNHCKYKLYVEQASIEPNNAIGWCSKIKDNKDADGCLYNSAYNNYYLELCNEISDSSRKDECISIVSNLTP